MKRTLTANLLPPPPYHWFVPATTGLLRGMGSIFFWTQGQSGCVTPWSCPCHHGSEQLCYNQEMDTAHFLFLPPFPMGWLFQEGLYWCYWCNFGAQPT